MVTPSDHLILKTEEFQRTAREAFDFICDHDALLTMGIKPNRPETGYGYIQVGEAVRDDFRKVKTFTEKPNLELAEVFLKSGEFYWNSGMFFWSARSILDALKTFAPDINSIFEAGCATMGHPEEQRFINAHYPSCRNISIDFAIMEHAPNVYVECVDLGWSDLGTWGSLYDNSPKNSDGNVTQRCKTMMINSHNNVVAIKGDKVLVASGLNDYIIADVDDALLIVPKSEEQKIKLYVNEVKTKYGERYL
jgi:mannose-1-phosphate guanylyltransferase